MISLARYAELFRVPGLRAMLLASIIGRIPIGVTALAILLFVQARSGSFAVAGSAAALYVLGLAAAAPFLGRMIDRVGPRPVLSASAVIHPGMLLTLVVLVIYTDGPSWVALAALLAGASFPPITICMRALYPRLLPDVALLQTAYSVDSALVETIFIIGPALVAVMVAVGYPYWAVLFAAGVILALASAGSATGALVYGSREWDPPIPRQFLVMVGLMAAGLLVIAPLEDVYLFAAANVIAGGPMAAVIAVQSLLVSQLAPRPMLAESFTWSAACLLGGISAGIAAGGVLAERGRSSRCR